MQLLPLRLAISTIQWARTHAAVPLYATPCCLLFHCVTLAQLKSFNSKAHRFVKLCNPMLNWCIHKNFHSPDNDVPGDQRSQINCCAQMNLTSFFECELFKHTNKIDIQFFLLLEFTSVFQIIATFLANQRTTKSAVF